MAERPWGFWTESKLDMLSGYLRAFTTASHNRASEIVYLDLFAGQDANTSKHTGLPIMGSMRRAIATTPPFTVLRGFELRKDRAASLDAAFKASAPGRDIKIYAGDVHDSLRAALNEIRRFDWAPTFAFVDPEGVEARWELLEILAAHKPKKTKVEVFLLLASPQLVRVVNHKLDEFNLLRAERQLTDLFGCEDWRPILQDRQAGILDPERTRDEFTNLMRWRLETTLGYKFTHTLRLTNVMGGPLYDMIFATDHEVGDKIMTSVYGTAAAKFPTMRREIRLRQREAREAALGNDALIPLEDLQQDDAPLRRGEKYQRLPASPPYGTGQKDQ